MHAVRYGAQNATRLLAGLHRRISLGKRVMPSDRPTRIICLRRRARVYALCLLGALCAVWVAFHARSARNQRLVVEDIQSLGGSVMYDYEARHDQIGKQRGQPGKATSPRAPAWLRAITGDDWFQSVFLVELRGSHITDANLPRLTLLHDIEFLRIRDTSVSDLSFVRQLPRLAGLDAAGSPITDDGVREVRHLGDLVFLNLSDTCVTDRCLHDLARVRSLDVVKLNRTAVSDVGVDHFRSTCRPELYVEWDRGWPR